MKTKSYYLLITVITSSIIFTGCNNQQTYNESNSSTAANTSQNINSSSSSQVTFNPTTNSGNTMSGGFMPTGGTKAGLNVNNIKNKFTNIAYSNDSTTQKLDIYLPNEGQGPFPVIIAIHGGAFKMGSKTGGDLSAMIKGVEKGYAVVCVDYRLSGEAIFPAAINDIQEAIKFIKNNATKYSLNPNKIATWGDSAGGNLAALAGSMGNKSDNTDIQAVVDWFGPIYFSKIDEQFSALGLTPIMGKTNLATSPESAYLGKTIGTPEAESLVKQASPESYISSDDPAFLIQHGTNDRNIPITQSQNFADALQQVLGKEKVTFIKLEGAGHGGEKFENDDNLKTVFEFLDKHLK